MAFVVQAEVQGGTELLAKLKALRGKGRRIQREAIRKAARPIRALARAKLAESLAESRYTSGLLEKSLIAKVVTKKDTVTGLIGPRTGMKQTVTGRDGRRRIEDPAKVAHFKERGVAPHQVGKGSSRRKNVKAGAMHPGFQGSRFMQAAADEGLPAARRTILTEVAAGIEKAAGG